MMKYQPVLGRLRNRRQRRNDWLSPERQSNVRQVALVTSGGLITDQTRAVSLDGDGRLNDGSIGIYKQIVNIIVNPSFEVNTVNWVIIGGTFTRDTSDKKFGVASGRLLATTGNVTGGGFITGATAGRLYHVSFWAKGNGISWQASEQGGAAGDQFIVTLQNVGLGNWSRVGLLGTPLVQNDRTSIGIQIAEITAMDTLIDGVQVTQWPYAQPFSDGIRQLGTLNAPLSLVNMTTGWIVAKIRPNFDNALTPGTGQKYLYSITIDFNNAMGMYFEPVNANWAGISRTGGVSTFAAFPSTHINGTPITVAAKWTALAHFATMGGATFATTVARTGPPAGVPISFEIGCSGAGQQLESDIMYFAHGWGNLTDANYASLDTLLMAGQKPSLTTLRALYPAADARVVFPMNTIYGEAL